MPAPRSLLVILGNQLFAPQHLPPPSEVLVFMAEDVGLCTYVRHHQQKIVLFLAAMRNYAEELRQGGYDVHYEHLDVNSTLAYEDRLQHVLDDSSIVEIQHFEIEDNPGSSCAGRSCPRRCFFARGKISQATLRRRRACSWATFTNNSANAMAFWSTRTISLRVVAGALTPIIERSFRAH
jgi:hypothetical protein